MHGICKKCIQNFSLKPEKIKTPSYISTDGAILLKIILGKCKVIDWTELK
jgi:hypothetical protein